MSETPSPSPEDKDKDAAVIVPATPLDEPKKEPSPEAPTKETQQQDAKKTTADKGSEAKAEKRRGGGFWGCLLDLFLVTLLTGTMGAGGWYLYTEMERYRVPTQMELATEEYAELCKERDALRDAAYHADEQLHMRQRLSGLDDQLSDLKRRINEKKASVDKEQARVIELQNEILKNDTQLRSVARSLLTGLSIGDAATTRGKVYRNAVIHRLEGNRITLRNPEGQACFPVRELVKDTLPDIARYAFGLDDLVDTSDFTVVKGQPAPKKRKGKLISAKNMQNAAPVKDYDPAAGAPVVDTNSAATSTITADDEAPAPEEDEWTPPAEGE